MEVMSERRDLKEKKYIHDKDAERKQSERETTTGQKELSGNMIRSPHFVHSIVFVCVSFAAASPPVSWKKSSSSVNLPRPSAAFPFHRVLLLLRSRHSGLSFPEKRLSPPFVDLDRKKIGCKYTHREGRTMRPALEQEFEERKKKGTETGAKSNRSKRSER
jgi:hypothetical protein